MTWRWPITFSLILWVLPPAWSASVGGQVELTNSRDPAVRKLKDYSGVVLWLTPAGSPAPPLTPRRVTMAQDNKRFVPHVLAISVGSTVDFPNHDAIFHNAFSNFSGQPFDVGLYPPKTTQSVTFTHAGIVRVFCNIHATMSAIIAVLSTPWYTVTPADGRFAIANVPPGEYGLNIFHERALPDNLRFLERRITVPEGGLTLPLISISETNYIPAPHFNKYGQPYPPNTEYGASKGVSK